MRGTQGLQGYLPASGYLLIYKGQENIIDRLCR